MPKAIKVDIASLPKDAEVELQGLGIFKNGSITTVSDEKLTEFALAYPDVEVPKEVVTQPVGSEQTENPVAATKVEETE